MKAKLNSFTTLLVKLKNEDHSDDKAQMEKLIKRDAKSYDDGALGALY